MNHSIRSQIEPLEDLRLPELQARYADIVGEPTRCPNKRFLIRRITEALEANADRSPLAPANDTAGEEETSVVEATPPEADAPDEPDEVPPDSAVSSAEARRLSQLSVPELQALYLEVVGRPTGSSHKRYLIWKVRQAQKGRISVGPRKSRHADGEAVDFKVLPLRMEADVVARLDEARERLGLKTRMDLFRRSLHAFLDEQGETEVAALFAAEA